MMKKKVYKAFDLDGTWCLFTELKDALEFIEHENENLELSEGETFDLAITVEMMTEEEIAALPEYTP